MRADLSFMKCHLHISKIAKDLEPILVGPHSLQLMYLSLLSDCNSCLSHVGGGGGGVSGDVIYFW